MDKLRELKLEVIEEFLSDMALNSPVANERYKSILAQQLLDRLEELEIGHFEAWCEVNRNDSVPF
mgnify:CR=1 FL=1